MRSLQLATRRLCREANRQFHRHFYRLPSIEIDALAPPLDQSVKLIMDYICLPPYCGPSTHDDVTPLMRIIKHRRPKVVFEFGTAHGNTIANVCQASDAYAFTINALPNQITGQLTTYTLTKDEIGCVYRQYGFQNRVTQIYANTLDFRAEDYLEGVGADLVIIDACHDTEYVINDFMKAIQLVEENAMILLHDTDPSMEGHLAGSYRACGILRRRGFDIKHLRNTWWAVLEKV